MPPIRRTYFPAALIALSIVSVGRCADDATRRLAEQLRPLVAVLSGQEASFSLAGHVETPIDGRMQKITVALRRFDDRSFDLDLEQNEYSVRAKLPNHGVGRFHS